MKPIGTTRQHRAFECMAAADMTQGANTSRPGSCHGAHAMINTAIGGGTSNGHYTCAGAAPISA